MKSKLCEMFGIEVPIFAFSHCRDVVVEVSKAGGLGVFGLARESPARLRENLRWIDEHIQGKPYGIDILLPNSVDKSEKTGADLQIPAKQAEFVQGLLDGAGIPRLSPEEQAESARENLESMNFSHEDSFKMLEIAMEHPIKLIVNGLGSPPASLVERAHAHGIKIAALAGSAKHALKHRDVGCDFVIAVGTEAGGHTGNISSLVLWPSVADAVAPLPVLGGGGVGRGRQLAAALALGCEGVWCGSVWLKTVQSDVLPEVKRRLFEASHEDAVHVKTFTGKPCRVLRGRYTEAWNEIDAPAPLRAPLQRYLWETEARRRIEKARAGEFYVYPVGQIAGDMHEETSVRNVVYEMMNELLEATERLENMVKAEVD